MIDLVDKMDIKIITRVRRVSKSLVLILELSDKLNKDSENFHIYLVM